MTIRLATLHDMIGIMDLLSRVVPAMNESGNYQWDSHYPNEQVLKEDIFMQQLWLAEINAELAGIAAITTDQDPEYADVGWDITETAIVTHRLAVDVNFRGNGDCQGTVATGRRGGFPQKY